MTHLDVDLLRTFSIIADTGSLTRAASEVGRTQSALSMQVRRIEEIVEGPVLVRTARGVELTGRGQRLLVHARRLVRAHDEAMSDITGRGLSGSIRLGCPEDYCIAFLPAILRTIATEHPRVTLDVFCASTPSLQKKLDARQLDLALVSLPLGDSRYPAVRHEQLVWVASTDFVFPADGTIRLALSGPETLDHRSARAALDAQRIAHQVAYASASKDGLLAIVRAGIAIAVLTRSAVPAELRILDGDGGLPTLPTIGISIATAPESGHSPLVESIRTVVARALGEVAVG